MGEIQNKELIVLIPLNHFRPKSSLRVPEHIITRSKFPVIDAHNHLKSIKDVGALLEDMAKYNIERIVDLDGETNGTDERQLARLVQAHPDRFALFIQIDASRVDEPDFAAYVANRVQDFVSRGATGIKFHKSLGLGVKDSTGKMLKPDDARLRPIWEAAARHNIPVTIHIADPVSFFDTIDHTNERFEELDEHPDWAFTDPKFYRYEELMVAQENLLRSNPETTFIVAHVGSMAEDLAGAGRMLDAFPNLYVDTAERIAELGRQPYSAREFLIKYQDRVLYGTDLHPKDANISANYRFYETFDEYFEYNDWDEHQQGRWNIYGVGLPDDVLKKIYHDNAMRIIFNK